MTETVFWLVLVFGNGFTTEHPFPYASRENCEAQVKHVQEVAGVYSSPHALCIEQPRSDLPRLGVGGQD